MEMRKSSDIYCLRKSPNNREKSTKNPINKDDRTKNPKQSAMILIEENCRSFLVRTGDFADDIRTYIDLHIEDEITIEDLCAASQKSPNQTIRLFKQKIRRYAASKTVDMSTEFPLSEENIEASVRIVSQVGIAPILELLKQNVDIIVAGRMCDTAIYATPCVFRGYDEGLAFHMAKIMSFMPTSSIRFEKWGAKSVSEWKLRMIIGKTTMGKDTAEMMKAKKCVHVSPRSVSPNLWIDSIRVDDVYLFDELGSIEAAWFFHVNELGPFMVDIDADGNNYFDRLDDEIATRKEQALQKLGIAPDYKFTKLY